MFSGLRTACPRRDLNARWSFSERFSNIGVSSYFSSSGDECSAPRIRYRKLLSQQSPCCSESLPYLPRDVRSPQRTSPSPECHASVLPEHQFIAPLESLD